MGEAPRLDGVALVTGGGRAVGANIARGLAQAGMRVAVGARTDAEVGETAQAIGGLALHLDVTDAASVAGAVERTERELGPIDLLVANAGVDGVSEPFENHDPDEWWHVHEVNVRGVYLSCRAVAPSMMRRGGGRIVIVGSMGGFSANTSDGVSTAYGSSKAAVQRFAEMLARKLAPSGIAVFSISPGLVPSKITEALHPDGEANWAPPEAAPRLVAALASGEFDALSGRFLQAVQDAPEHLRGRIEEILDRDLNAVRLKRS